jgi:hypothetical protein
MVLTATSPMTNNNINTESKAEFGKHQKGGFVTKSLRIRTLYNKIVMALWEITSPHVCVGRQADLSLTVSLSSFSC